LDNIKNQDFDCILTDVKMPEMDGLQLLREVQQIDPFIPIIMISDKSSISTAVEAMQQGAYYFVEKFEIPDVLLLTIEKAIERKSLFTEKNHLLNEISELHKIIGKSNVMQEVYNQINLAAPTNSKVLILGETGTGKELVARAIHYNSKRNGQPFIKVNCASIPDTLMESELFGHRRGAFTGASRDQIGKFKAADKGTLFLDEIGDLNLNLQAKLLNVLEDNQIEVIGETQPEDVDVRIITATNKNLKEMISEGKFREDLYHRINVLCIQLPLLNERKDDIPELAEYFLKINAEEKNKPLLKFSPQALVILQRYDWPGNIRELKNVIEKISIFSSNNIIQAYDVQTALEVQKEIESTFLENSDLKSAVNNFEKDFIENVLNTTNWKMQETAELLKVERTTLYKKIKNYNLHKPDDLI